MFRRRAAKHSNEAELDKLAEITPEDIEYAHQQWRRSASAEFRELLDADSQPEDEA